MTEIRQKLVLVRYSEEPLELICEWENCMLVMQEIEVLVHHLTNEHLKFLDSDDLHCHWKDCEGFTENISELRRHILLHAFHAKLKCHGSNLLKRKNLQHCFSSEQTRNIIPELPDPLLCCWEECFVVYECPEYFYRHVDSHAVYDSKKDNSFNCLWQECNRTFNSISKVKEHLRSHTQEKLIACPTCGGMFASRTKFFDHIQRQLPETEDDKPGPYICEYCSRTMNSERLLRDHVRHHVNHYKCPYCDMTCPTPSGVATHVAYRHSENKPHACKYCDYSSTTETDLRKHLESHSMVPTFKCPVENCTYASRSQTCYRTHYRKQHEGKDNAKYSCHLCDKVFTRGNYLTKHLLKDHKFRWPSGHCRFRYCMNEDGLLRLQTVRYESLELSQEMMGEDVMNETIDDPDCMIDIHSDKTPANESFNANELLESDSSTLHPSYTDHSEVQDIQEASSIQIQEGSILINTNLYLTSHPSSSGEPVLLKIVDVAECDITQSTAQTVSKPMTAVQSITKDAHGMIVFETVEFPTS